jgi:hypothetical protein
MEGFMKSQVEDITDGPSRAMHDLREAGVQHLRHLR